MLLRSGALWNAPAADIERLHNEYNLRFVVDQRGADEIGEMPDPIDKLTGIRSVHIDVLSAITAGISRGSKSKEIEWRLLSLDQNARLDLLTKSYPHLLLDDAAIAGYRKFFQELFSCTEGAVLWHCSLGRDRCGMVSMLVETALGVPYADIEDDHLATAAYCPIAEVGDSGASLRSLPSAVFALEKQYGSLRGYIHTALGISSDEIAALRVYYFI